MNNKHQDIIKLLKLTNTLETSRQLVDAFTERIPVSKGLIKKINQILLSEENMNELTNEMVKLYDENFTHKEIKDVTKFYASASGKTFLSKFPEMLIKFSELGRTWGIRIFERSQGEINKAITEFVVESMIENVDKKAEASKFVESRLDFIQRYVKEKGWDIDNLTPEQSEEIKKQKEWSEEKR